MAEANVQCTGIEVVVCIYANLFVQVGSEDPKRFMRDSSQSFLDCRDHLTGKPGMKSSE